MLTRIHTFNSTHEPIVLVSKCPYYDQLHPQRMKFSGGKQSEMEGKKFHV